MNNNGHMPWHHLLGDAFALPFRDETFDVVIAEPPYEGKNRGKHGVHIKQVGYLPFSGRSWWAEAWRVLKPSGHLYIVCSQKELPRWLETCGDPIDIICWYQSNSPSLSAYWRRGTGGRAPSWRPILHYHKHPPKLLQWPDGFVDAGAVGSSRSAADLWFVRRPAEVGPSSPPP